MVAPVGGQVAPWGGARTPRTRRAAPRVHPGVATRCVFLPKCLPHSAHAKGRSPRAAAGARAGALSRKPAHSRRRCGGRAGPLPATPGGGPGPSRDRRALGRLRRGSGRAPGAGGRLGPALRGPLGRLWILLCDSRLGLWRKRRGHTRCTGRLLARVDAPMRGQVGLIGEALPALGALVRALARMHAAVGVRLGLWRALATAGTLERASRGVPPGRARSLPGAPGPAAPGPWPPSPPAPEATWTRLCVTSWSH